MFTLPVWTMCLFSLPVHGEAYNGNVEFRCPEHPICMLSLEFLSEVSFKKTFLFLCFAAWSCPQFCYRFVSLSQKVPQTKRGWDCTHSPSTAKLFPIELGFLASPRKYFSPISPTMTSADTSRLYLGSQCLHGSFAATPLSDPPSACCARLIRCVALWSSLHRAEKLKTSPFCLGTQLHQ